MGIWNQGVVVNLCTHELLITPHGDLEQFFAFYQRNSHTSHNPSWGFGTWAIVIWDYADQSS